MNHRGEIAALAEIARPGVGLVTNIGTAHIEHLGSRDEIAREKGDLLAALPADGAAVVNAEDDYREALAARTQAPVLSFGRAPGADVTAEDAQLRDDAGFAFRLRSPQGAVAARVAGLGETTLVNALGAAAAALAAGARLDEVAEGLARYRPVAGRLERRELPGGVVLVDDSYNANPQSMEVALRLLARSGSSGRRVAVLGDMGELGEASGAAHREAGRLAASLGINFLVAVGQQAEQVAEGATAAGMSSSRIRVARRGRRLGAGQGFPRHADGAGRGVPGSGGGLLMFYHLLYPLASDIGAFNVFRYITFRIGAATLTALFIAFLVGPPLIRKLSSLRVGQPIREIGPDHQDKAGTPTMGGLLILLSLLVSVLLWSNLDNRFVWTVIAVTAGFGLLGFIDDYHKVNQGHSGGISARMKLVWQTGLAFLVALAIYSDPAFDAELAVPFFKNFTPNIGWLYIPVATFIIVGASNAVNLTDGLDGLAIGPVMVAAGTFLLLSYAAGHAGIAEYLAIKSVPGAGTLAIFCGALIGGGLGFLWFNASPAQLFMGDVGSLALGGALGTIAVLIRQEILLAVVGGIFVVETLSVMIQVAWFKLTGKRVFLMAPIHHHFEQLGWPEQKIVVRFWIISMILGLVALSSLKLR
jgi:phospho-N-acetylmuramoyl-pentapeptide-transferase